MKVTLPPPKPAFRSIISPKILARLQWTMGRVRQLIYVGIPRRLYRLTGIQLLTGEQTNAFLSPYRLNTHPANQMMLPQVVDWVDPGKLYYPATVAQSEPVSVWQYKASGAQTRQYPFGSILAVGKILCLDVNTDDFFRNVLHRKKRQPVSTTTLIAPWSHYLDGVVWGGYFDFVMLVAGKLCRIKEAIPETTFNEAIVAYPLFDTAYEREYLSLLGIDAAHIMDSRTTQVRFEYCVLANTGHWFYPNKADIDALRKCILPKLSAPTGKRNRVYISRAGRRRVLNESELLDLLRRYDIELIDDKPRSVAEQVAIYQNAEFIIGPHGASFVNILWCQPGTHLFELFAPTYFPDFYRNMAEQLGLRYSAYFHGPAGTGGWAEGLEADMYVSVDELERCLVKVFNNEAVC